MIEVLTSGQMRAVETGEIGTGRAEGMALMERAGQAVAEVLDARFGGTGRRARILCGPGNNGGDGYVVARLLKARGWTVEVLALGTLPSGNGDAARNCRAWAGQGAILPLAPRCQANPADVVVDALFGTGLTRPVPAEVVEALAAGHREAPLVAVDILSGLDADCGRPRLPDGCMLPAATVTVTFERPKCGHLIGEGPRLSGELLVAPIGLNDAVRGYAAGRQAEVAQLVEPADIDPARLTKPVWAHKYDHGHALVMAGGPGRGGAARLAARAALRIGAGLVTVLCPPEAMTENAARLDAVMLRGVADLADFAAVLEDRRVTALCLGPGMGHQAARAFLPEALAARHLDPAGKPSPPVACVLDADALSAFAEMPEDLFAMLHPGCVLTPHWGEFARLFPDLARATAAPQWQLSRMDAARRAAARAGCTLLLKGATTVVAEPSGRVRLVSLTGAEAAPWLATAGSGDVLAGLVTGLLARGTEPAEAAVMAAWLQGAAAREVGPGLIAEDLPEAVPRLLAGLLRTGPDRFG